MTSLSFHHSSSPTSEVLELSFMNLCSPRFPRILICMISELWSSWSLHHSSLPTLEVLDLSFMDLCSPHYPSFCGILCKNPSLLTPQVCLVSLVCFIGYAWNDGFILYASVDANPRIQFAKFSCDMFYKNPSSVTHRVCLVCFTCYVGMLGMLSKLDMLHITNGSRFYKYANQTMVVLPS